MKKEANILVLDDDSEILSTLKILLGSRFSKITICERPEQIDTLIDGNIFDVILLDMNFNSAINTGNEGIFWLDRILSLKKDQLVIMITAYGNVDQAVESMRIGAHDYVLKPWENERLITSVSGAIELSISKKKYSELQTRHNSLLKDSLGKDTILGRSFSFREILKKAEKAAPTDASILIMGENGTGKTILAKHIHINSKRNTGPFITVDLGSLSSSLFESELFGYKKGAFTGAISDYSGRLFLANGGTLFLDEIGNLSIDLQSKLLSVLEAKKYVSLGDNKEKNIDVRIIAATNKPIYSMVDEDGFREDLLYRLNTIELTLPPLKERTNDIKDLAELFLDKYRTKYNKPALKLPGETLEKMLVYPWPGNVRELENVIEKAVILVEGDTIMIEDLGLRRQKNTRDVDTPLTIEQIERMYIDKSLQRHNGNITKVAQELGISRPSIYRKIKNYGL